MASTVVLAKERADNRQVLDPVVVRGQRPPLIKLNVNYRLLTARFGAAAVTDGDYIYVIGGGNSQGVPLDDIERFNLRTGVSEPFAKLKIARRHHRAVLYLGKIYVLGGYSGTGFAETEIFENSMEVVDLATGKVTQAPRMLIAKANFGCAISGGKIYVIGGAKVRGNNLASTNSVEVFDLARNTWEKGLAMPIPRMNTAVNVEDFIIVPGGTSNRQALGNVEVLNPRDQVWRELPPLHKHVSANSLVFLDHYLFLFAEHELVAYELREKKSESFAFEYTAAGDTAAIINDGKIFVIGGREYAGPALEDTFSQPSEHVTGRGPSTGEAAMKNPFVLKAGDPLRDGDGMPDFGAMKEIQVFELRSVIAPASAKKSSTN